MPLNLPLLRSARTCGLLHQFCVIFHHIQNLTLRTNVRVASFCCKLVKFCKQSYAPHERAGCFDGLRRLCAKDILTLRTNVRVASVGFDYCAQLWYTYAPHERAGCFSKIAQLCVMPVRILCTGFVPYREFDYYPKAELRPLARFKDAKSPYSYANAPALSCELAVRTRLLF